MPLFKLFICPSAKHSSGGIAGSRGKVKSENVPSEGGTTKTFLQSSSWNRRQSDRRCTCLGCSRNPPPPTDAAWPQFSRSFQHRGKKTPRRLRPARPPRSPAPAIGPQFQKRFGAAAAAAGITRYHGNAARRSPNGRSFRQAAPRGPGMQRLRVVWATLPGRRPRCYGDHHAHRAARAGGGSSSSSGLSRASAASQPRKPLHSPPPSPTAATLTLKRLQGDKT